MGTVAPRYKMESLSALNLFMFIHESDRFMVGIVSFKSYLIQHYFVNYGPD